MADDRWWEPYSAVIFDLDGTLLRLDVDWERVEADVGVVLESAGLDPAEYTAWELLDAAGTVGLEAEVDAIIADHELEGAKRCRRLPLADSVRDIDRPMGVVSLNSTRAVRLALRRQSLLGAMDTVVGRGSVPERKPAPDPLLSALADIGVSPEEAVFVGDSEGDRTTARRAGVDFLSVEAIRE